MRAQTTLDFAIGASVFLVTVAAVFTFTPGLVDPFVNGGQGGPVVANRAASALATEELGDPEDPFVLEESAVDTFFTNATGDQTYVQTQLGLSDRFMVNVTLDGDDINRQVGPVPPGREDVAVAWRVVHYQDERAELVVRVW